MKSGRTLCLAAALMTIAFWVGGCATHISKPAQVPQPTTVRFNNFQKYEMKEAVLSPAFAGAEANQRALKKINEHLAAKMGLVFPGLRIIPAGAGFTPNGQRTLQIVPLIKEIKFISGGARFMVGAMAGSSAVLMQVEFRDSQTSAVVAAPEFYRAANAQAGGFTVGATDNKMLEDIAQDVVNYSIANK
jgi:hypothetical protein